MTTFYKILTYLLVPVGLLFALTTALLFAAAIENPQLLLGLFMVACTAIYIFVSFYFVVGGINQDKPVGAITKKWLIANGIVTGVYCGILFFTCASLTMSSENMNEFVTMFSTNFKSPENISTDQMISILKSSLFVAVVLSFLLLVHTILSIRIVKQYQHLFE